MRSYIHRAREHVTLASLVVTFLPGLVALAIVILARAIAGIRIDVLLSEPSAVGGLPPWTGFVALLGTMGWATAFGAFLTGLLVARGAYPRHSPFLAASAAFTAYLCLDDTLLLHEEMLPRIGIPEYVVYAFIGVCATAYLWFFRQYLLEGATLFLVLSFALLGVSVLSDLVDQTFDLPLGYFATALVEDGAKLFGISAWASFALLTVRDLVRYPDGDPALDQQVPGERAPVRKGATPR